MERLAPNQSSVAQAVINVTFLDYSFFGGVSFIKYTPTISVTSKAYRLWYQCIHQSINIPLYCRFLKKLHFPDGGMGPFQYPFVEFPTRKSSWSKDRLIIIMPTIILVKIMLQGPVITVSTQTFTMAGQGSPVYLIKIIAKRPALWKGFVKWAWHTIYLRELELQ